MQQTVVGVFERFSDARRAADELESQGLPQHSVHIDAIDEDRGINSATALPVENRHRGSGALASVRSFFADIFSTDDVNQREEASNYAEAVRRCNAVVTVDVEDETQLDAVRQTLENAGAVDIDEKVSAWRQSGYKGFDENAAGLPPQAGQQGPSDVIPVVQEELEVGKRQVAGGVVRVYARTVSKPVSESVDLRSETAIVERLKVDRPASEAEVNAFQERTIEVTEITERPVVSKTARVVEEVVVGKEVTHQTEEIRDKVRRTDVNVERTGSASTGQRRFEDYNEEFRRDHATRFVSQGAYTDYEPAYRHGYTLRLDSQYAGQEWNAVEPHARQQWETQHPDTPWERVKSAVHHAWERIS